MLGPSHAVLGASAAGVTLIMTGTNLVERPGVFLISWGVGILAALLPDIDSPNATIRVIFGVGRDQAWRELRRRRGKGFFERLLDVLQWIISHPLNAIDLILPHRGVTHWGITFLGLTLGVAYLSAYMQWPAAIWVAFAAGYASHLVGDGVTRSGVPLYRPFRRRSVRFLPRALCIRTGGRAEKVMLYGLIFLLATFMASWLALLYNNVL